MNVKILWGGQSDVVKGVVILSMYYMIFFFNFNILEDKYLLKNEV